MTKEQTIQISSVLRELADAVENYINPTCNNGTPTNPQFVSIADRVPSDGQPCWVKNKNGAMYKMTYPFCHKDYPLWYPLPQE